MTEDEKVSWYIKLWNVFYTGDTGIHVWRWRLVYIWIILFTALTVYSFHNIRHVTSQNHKLIIQNRQLSLQGVEAHSAICRFRKDLSDRVHQSEHFLKEHPNGIPGIATANEIRTSLKGQKATLRSFNNFKCK